MTLGQFYDLPAEEQDYQLAQWEDEAQRCSCGHPKSVCSDPKQDWFPQRTICRATMNQQAAQARWDEMHADKPFHDGNFEGWSKERTDQAPFHYSAGVTIWVATADVQPDDEFLTSRGSGPNLESPLP